jgi:hypothetical protein
MPRAFNSVDANARLTAAMGLVLLVLLPVEGVTLLSLRSLLTVHMLVGVALIPPIALKLASAGYRFLRYYSGDSAFREAGPPQPTMRFLVAPALVASTVGLLSSGVALMLIEHPSAAVYTVHKASFIVWFGALGIHVLAYLRRLTKLVLADWPQGRHGELGRRLRRRAVAGSLLGGVVVAAVAAPIVAAWHR